MIKLNKYVGTALVYVLAALFISGCTSKNDVVIDDNTKSQEVVQPAQEEMMTTSEENNGMNGHDKMNDTMAVVKEKSYINETTSEIDGKSITLKSVHFAFDKYSLSDEMRTIAKNNSKLIVPVTSNNPNVKIKLEGNCDEWGTDEYNYALGLKRAKTAKDALIRDGINKNKIVLVSFGESNPICTDKTNDCYKKNRRVDYRLLP